MEKEMTLYCNNSIFACHLYENREDWKAKRILGIGGSDASTMVNKNPYKTASQLWKEKTKRIEPKELNNSAIKYGTDAEEHIRALYELKHPEIQIQYMDNCTFQSKEVPWRLYSPDGLIINENGERGILEIKTSLIQNKSMLEQWNNNVPEHYYIQTLHGLLVTDFDFVVFCAELRFSWNNEAKIIERSFTREEALNDLQWLEQAEKQAWLYYENDIEPPLTIKI